MSASELPTVRRGQTLTQRRAADPASAPLVLERYRLRRRLGAGAFGTVWDARDERLQRDVAVKIVPRERIVGGRFEREARVAARLSHPAIVTLYEAAVDDDGAYLVSELVRGSTLHSLLESGRLSDRDILGLGIALCDALAHAHAEGVIHRDVKPSNVLIPARPTSSSYPAKLTDFGVARVLGGDSLTRTGDVVGTAAYMAPEQAEGRPVGPEADLYSLALVLYEALTGINPVRSATTTSRQRRLAAHLPPLRRQRRDLPRELGAGIDLALRPRPRERGTVGELRCALQASVASVGDRAGIVAPPWRRPWPTRDSAQPSEPFASAAVAEEIEARRPDAEDHGRANAAPPHPAEAGAQQPPELAFDGSARPALARWARAAAALGAAGTAIWPGTLGLLPAAVPPGVLGVVAAVLVLALPRVGWVALAVALAAAAAASGHAGAALVLLALMLIPVAVVPGRAADWPLPSGAVALGLIGLAGAWPAVAARIAQGAWRRAVLAAGGFIWLAGAGELAGADLYLRRPRSALAPGVWSTSPAATVDHVFTAIVSPGVLAGALVWALAAVMLPWLARGRPLLPETVVVALWAALALAGTGVAIAVAGPDRGPAGGVAVLGTLAGCGVALWPALWRARGRAGLPSRAIR